MVAVSQDGLSLAYTDDKFKCDREIVLKAVSTYDNSLQLILKIIMVYLIIIYIDLI